MPSVIILLVIKMVKQSVAMKKIMLIHYCNMLINIFLCF